MVLMHCCKLLETFVIVCIFRASRHAPKRAMTVWTNPHHRCSALRLYLGAFFFLGGLSGSLALRSDNPTTTTIHLVPLL